MISSYEDTLSGLRRALRWRLAPTAANQQKFTYDKRIESR